MKLSTRRTSGSSEFGIVVGQIAALAARMAAAFHGGKYFG